MLDLKGWALIVVDMQNDFLAQDGYYAQRERYERQVRQGKMTASAMTNELMNIERPQSREFKPRSVFLKPVIGNVCRVIAKSREKRMPIAYLKAVYGHEFRLKPRFLLENLDREHYPCKANTWGAEFIDPVKELRLLGKTASKEKVVEKHTFNGFFKTKLGAFLRACKIHTVVIAGVETHICVLATAQGASYNQFKTIILTDCVATARQYRSNYAFNIFRDGFGMTKRSTEIF